MTTENKDEQDDTIFFGDWVYCGQHMRPHTTGWCSVYNLNKMGLGIKGKGEKSRREAYHKCYRLGLKIYEDGE